MSLDTTTLDELDELTLAELDEMYLGSAPTLTDEELLSLLQFNNRAFTRMLPVDLATPGDLAQLLGLWRGKGEEVEGVFAHGCGPRSTTNVGPKAALGVGVLGFTNVGQKAVECCKNEC